MEELTDYRPSTLFTVRVWAEEGTEGRQEWRGTVRRLPDGRERTFRGWPALVSILEKMVENGEGRRRS